MPKQQSEFDRVRDLVMQLPDVVEGTIHGAPSWKLGKELLTCPAIHKSAEPNTLLVKLAPDDREELIATEPDIYYVTDHYQKDPIVLVRLAMIDRKSLKALLKKAHHFVSGK